jgi:Domain of unknown function (DUF4129)
MAGRGMRVPVEVRRAAASVLFLAVAIIGLRAGDSFSAASQPTALYTTAQVLYWALVATAAALVILGLVQIVAWLIWGRDQRLQLPPRRRRSPWRVLVIPVAALALARLLAVLREHLSRATGTVVHARPAARGANWRHLYPPGSSWPLLVTLSVAALVAAALIVPLRRSRPPAPVTGPPPAGDEQLAVAVAAATQALRGGADPRAAIVECYAAMEQSLAKAGAPAVASDTPAEILARAAAEGLVRSAAAGRLTTLFRQARYSRHPVTEADRSSALDALARLRSDLTAPA